MRKIILVTITTLFIITLLSAQVSSTFDTDLEFWKVEGDSDYDWSATLGNPGGCLTIDDYAVGDINTAWAPNKYLGDWSGATSSDYISADVHLDSPYTEYIEDVNHVFEISGPGGDAWAIADPYPANHSWTTYTVTLAEANWTIERGTWADILANVQSFFVTVEFIEGDETDRLDNVYLSFTPPAYEVPIGTISDFEQPGFDGWAFTNVSSVNNETSGGNPHRYIYVNGEDNFTTALAASKFTGSWHLLENNAAILMDLKKISPNTNFNSPPYLFKISNDNSSAIYPLPNNFNLRLNQWVTVIAMIQESDWTVLTGSWADLMDNVGELRVALDFYDTQSIIGLDNFRVNNEPPEVHFTVDNRDIFLGEQVHFTDLSNNSPDSWNWLFGDGGTSGLQNPTHLYQNIGQYDVTLNATNIFGTSSLTKDNFITVYDPNDDFHDDFEDGRINDLWTLIRGNWREENGYLEQTSNVGSGDSLNQGCFAILGNEDWQNYEIRADILNLDNEGIGLVLNYQNEDNFYLFQWDSNEYQHAAIYKYENGEKFLLVSNPITYQSNTHYNVAFSNIDGKLTVYIDSNAIMSYQERVISEGKSGVWCSGSTGARYYDYSVLFKPEKPNNIQISRSGNNVTLQWDSVHNATYYNIYTSDDDDNYVLEVEGVPTTSWTGTISDDIKFFKVTANK